MHQKIRHKFPILVFWTEELPLKIQGWECQPAFSVHFQISSQHQHGGPSQPDNTHQEDKHHTSWAAKGRNSENIPQAWDGLTASTQRRWVRASHRALYTNSLTFHCFPMLYTLLSASQPSLSYEKGQAMRISWIWSGLDTTTLHWHSGAASRQDPCVGIQTSTWKGTGTSAAEAAGWVYLDNAEMRTDPRLHKAELGISSGTFSLQESHSLPYPSKPPLPSPPPPSCLLHGRRELFHARHPQHLPVCSNPARWTSLGHSSRCD